MTDKEKIARWRGPFIEVSMGNKQISPLETLGVIDGQTWIVGPRRWVEWQPDTDITLWHGKDGLLAEIEKRDEWDDFESAFIRVVCGVGSIEAPALSRRAILARALYATAAQLTAALVEVIDAKEKA